MGQKRQLSYGRMLRTGGHRQPPLSKHDSPHYCTEDPPMDAKISEHKTRTTHLQSPEVSSSNRCINHKEKGDNFAEKKKIQPDPILVSERD